MRARWIETRTLPSTKKKAMGSIRYARYRPRALVWSGETATLTAPATRNSAAGIVKGDRQPKARRPRVGWTARAMTVSRTAASRTVEGSGTIRNRTTYAGARAHVTAASTGVIADGCLVSSGPASVSVLVREDGHERDEDDLQVKSQGPILDVVEVVDQPLLDRGLAAEVVDLSPPGQPWPDEMAVFISRHARLELRDELRPFGSRAYKAHLSDQDIPELRQLVEAEPAEELADPRSPRVSGGRPDRAGSRLSVGGHGPELVHDHRLLIEASPLLMDQHRAARAELHEQGDQSQDRRDRDHAEQRDDDVEGALRRCLRSVNVEPMSELEERYAVELVGAHPAGHDLEHARHDAKVDAGIAARVDQLEDLGLGQLGLGDESQVGLLSVDGHVQWGQAAVARAPA